MYHGLSRPSVARGRGHPPGVRAGRGGRQRARSTSCTCRRPRRSRRWPRPATPGANVFAETCPQYLYLTLEDTLARPGFEGAKWVLLARRSAPATPTTRRDLWKGLRTNELAVVSTDHCPFCFKEQKEIGLGNFSKIPNGMGGVEHRMDLIYQGVVAGQLSLARWVETCSVDAGADVRAVPRRRGSSRRAATPTSSSTTRRPATPSASRPTTWTWTTRPGRASRSTARWTPCISRGKVIVENDQYVGRKGHGQFLKRGLSQYLI